MSDRQKKREDGSIIKRIAQETIFQMVKNWMIIPMIPPMYEMKAHFHDFLIYVSTNMFS